MKPGKEVWMQIHRMSLVLNDNEFTEFIKQVFNSIECPKCKNHMREYLKKHKLKDYPGRKFEWSWEFHNEVNKRLKKRQVPFNRAVMKVVNDSWSTV